MLKQMALLGFLSILAVGMVACGPAPEPVAEEEPPPPPPPPPPVYELTEVDLATEAPDFTSRNVSVLGVKVGDRTNDVGDVLGEIANTQTDVDDYITAYQGGGVVVYTFKLTGAARRIEITSLFDDDLASPPLQDWLDDGDVDQLRELMGPEESIEELPDSNATAYVYDARGVRFIQYDVSGTEVNAIRFSEFFD
jgi:hypothetical protein